MYSDDEDLRADRCYCGGNPQVESRYGSFFVICKECGCLVLHIQHNRQSVLGTRKTDGLRGKLKNESSLV